LEDISTRITNTVKSVNRVLFNIHAEEGEQYRCIPAYVTKDRLDLLREIDHWATELLYEYGDYDTIWQMPVVILPLINEKGHQCIVLRPIASTNAMTARFVPLRKEIFNALVVKMKQIDGLGDLFLDLTHKPPGTIEWE